MDRNKCVITVPIYKTEFDFDEYNSIKQLFRILGQYDIIAFYPESLDLTYYKNNFNFTNYYMFWDEYFTDYPKGYNKLMLQSGFYECFSEYEYMLVYQPDCWVFRNELEYWVNKEYDYVGSPFILNYEYKYYLTTQCHIGNGGFSLRKISFFKNLCKQYEHIINNLINYNDYMFGEDHIILQLKSYNIDLHENFPTFFEASKFSWEIAPHLMYQIHDKKLPFGCHGYNKIQDKQFWNDFICYDKKSYSIITFLFGDYDILRDPDEIDETAEYICITDRKDLKSNVWKFEEITEYDISGLNDWQKTIIARYTALNHSSTPICVIMDASVHIKKSIKEFVMQSASIELTFLIHPWRTSYLDEIDEWINKRNLDPIQKEQFISYCNEHNYDYNVNGFIMTTFMIQLNSGINKWLNNYVLTELMNNFNFSTRIDQLYYSIIFINKVHNINYLYNIMPLSMQIFNSDYLDYYYHNENRTHSGEYICEIDKPDMKLFNNFLYTCKFFI